MNNDFVLEDCRIYRTNEEFYEYVKDVDNNLCAKDEREERDR